MQIPLCLMLIIEMITLSSICVIIRSQFPAYCEPFLSSETPHLIYCQKLTPRNTPTLTPCKQINIPVRGEEWNVCSVGTCLLSPIQTFILGGDTHISH